MMKVTSGRGAVNRPVSEKIKKYFEEESIGQANQTTAIQQKEASSWFTGLVNLCPDTQVYVKKLSGPSDIRDFAGTHYGGLQLVVSPEALKRMASDPEFRKQCEEALAESMEELEQKLSKLGNAGKRVLGKGLYLDEEGKASQWTVSEKTNQVPETLPWKLTTTTNKPERGIDRYRSKEGKLYEIKKKLNYRPAKDLVRIAKAHNQQTAKAAISSIRANIYQLRQSSDDKQTAKQLIGQAERVLLKAQLKVKLLKKEEYMKYVEKRAREDMKEERAALVRRQLQEHRTKRVVREYGQIRDYYPTPQEMEREKEHAREWLDQIAGGGLSGAEYGLGSYLAAPALPAVEISISGSMGSVIDVTL